ncbi:MAG: endonuclease/exonuclease/phosphatase family protein [Clostridia bacterium]|nr:endonuclease/exonuclease/phosphatase family protein [Clostridia bacterium]
MLFKICQIFVTVCLAIASVFTPLQEPAPTEPVGININPNPVAEAVSFQNIKTMSFNLKISGEGLQANDLRLPRSVKMIEKHFPDSFGVQEADKWWTDSLEEALPQYARVGTYRDDGISLGESCSIFYLKDKYELIDSGDFWLSETPDTPSWGWDTACPRIATYAILRCKESGFVYAHFNTHFDHVGKVAQSESVPLLASRIAAIAPDIPVVLTGDFNTREGSEIYNKLISCGLKDTKFMAEKHDDCATYHDYNPFVFNTKPIDCIFTNAYCSSVKSSIVDSSAIDLIYPSDHFPIIVELTLFNGGN